MGLDLFSLLVVGFVLAWVVFVVLRRRPPEEPVSEMSEARRFFDWLHEDAQAHVRAYMADPNTGVRLVHAKMAGVAVAMTPEAYEKACATADKVRGLLTSGLTKEEAERVRSARTWGSDDIIPPSAHAFVFAHSANVPKELRPCVAGTFTDYERLMRLTHAMPQKPGGKLFVPGVSSRYMFLEDQARAIKAGFASSGLKPGDWWRKLIYDRLPAEFRTFPESN